MWQLFSCILEHSATTLLLSSNTHPRELYFFWVFVCISSLRLLSIWFFFLHESQIHAKEFLSFLGSKYAQLQCTLHSGSFFFFKKLLKYKKCQELFCHFLSFFFEIGIKMGRKSFAKISKIICTILIKNASICGIGICTIVQVLNQGCISSCSLPFWTHDSFYLWENPMDT